MTYKEKIVQDGFVVVKNVWSENEIVRLRSALENVYKKVNDQPDQFTTRYTSKEEQCIDTWGVNNIFDPRLYEEPFGEVFTNRRLMVAIEEILGKELRFWGAHALWSPQVVGYELRWHRDYGDNEYYQIYGIPNHLQFNIPLYEDQSFIAVPQSHKRALNPEERNQVMNNGTKELPGQQQVICHVGDVLLMNAHTLHRGKCSNNVLRRTLHFSVQSKNETYGGHTSTAYMRDEAYLASMNPIVQTLMRNLVHWDDEHPLSRAEAFKQLKQKKEREDNVAGQQRSGTA
jgi:ectoine hydroxylase-related dioxygenase (phytanoyl-CoA dioxygenase family)